MQQLAAGRIARARGAQAVNEALRDVLAGMWLDYNAEAGRVLGEFKLRPRDCSLAVPRLVSPLRPFAEEFAGARLTSGLTFLYSPL